MILTTYTDSALIRAHLERARRAVADEDKTLRVAALLDDLGVTITDNEHDADEVRAKIPEHLLYHVRQKGVFYVFVHARVEGLK